MIKDFGLNYGEIFKQLNQQVALKINRRFYRELLNVSYEVDHTKHKRLTKSPNEEDDKVERTFLVENFIKNFAVFKDDRNSRRLIFPNLYPNGLGKCISSVSAFIRNEEIFINVYIRSQDFLNNFEYDCETLSFLMRTAIKTLSVKPGKITVFCNNLHYSVEDYDRLIDRVC